MYTIEQYCIDHNLRFKTKRFEKFMQYIIFDGVNKSILNVYDTGTLLVQGKNNDLKLKLLSFVKEHKIDYWK
jgi:hypothetical protein